MGIITREMLAEYLIKEVVEQYKKESMTTSTGENLAEEMWNDTNLLGEIFYNKMFEYVDEEEL